MEEAGSSCDRCRRVDGAITDWCRSKEEIFKKTTPERRIYPPKTEDITLGSFRDLESRTHCKTCQDIVRAIVHDGKQMPLHETLKFSIHVLLRIVTNQSIVDSDERNILRLTLYPIQAAALAFRVGRAFDQQISTGLLRQWVNCCQLSHRDRCSSSGLSPPSHKIYLIDVEQGCLVQKSADVRYIALSYVWGDVEMVSTTKNNIDYLKKPGTIGPDIYHLSIPNTVRDAMRLVSLLNERYLWVDALCIVQDEQDTKRLHLNSMASIYANSSFTIIAAGGDNANHGLQGISKGTESRNIMCDTIRFPSGQELLAYRSRAWYPEHTTWDSRAWTFQEALFSRRLLIFNGLVSWVCRTAIWEEHAKSSTEDLSYTDNPVMPSHKINFAVQAPTWPDLDYWVDLVETFNCRQLTFDEDAINAFAGTTSVFNRVFSGGIFWGMPEIFFDFCMLWRPSKVVRRRRGGSNTPSKTYFPSWSWLGWQGDIRAAYRPALCDGPEVDDQTIRIQSVVQWYRSKNTSSDTVPINNVYPSLYRTYSENRTGEVPLGWNRALYPDETPYYTHDSLPSLRFRSPMPLVNENSDNFLNDQNPYLYFKAQRAWFYIGDELHEDRVNWTSCPASLVDNEGKMVGSIRLNIDRSDGPPTGDTCELVALSLGTAASNGSYFGILDEWDVPGLPCTSGMYQFYFVMWIEWKNGVAYRKAIGTVFKDTWERQPLEDIDVILG